MILLLEPATGMLSTVDTDSDPRVNVTINHVVQGRTDNPYANRVFEAICALRDRSESASSSVEDCPWLND